MEALGFRQHSEAMEPLLVMGSISPQLQATKALLDQALAAGAASAPAPRPAAAAPSTTGAAASVDPAALARALAQAMAPAPAATGARQQPAQRRLRVTPQMLARQLERLLLEGGLGPKPPSS
jgi:hypothetical protein